MTIQSERKWKEKVKEWGFEKNVPTRDMNFIVAKAEKRKAEGKETIFYRNGTQFDESTIEQFKKKETDINWQQYLARLALQIGNHRMTENKNR